MRKNDHSGLGYYYQTSNSQIPASIELIKSTSENFDPIQWLIIRLPEAAMDQEDESNCIEILTHKDAFQYCSVCCCAVLASLRYAQLSEEEGDQHIAHCHPNTEERHGELVGNLGLVPI